MERYVQYVTHRLDTSREIITASPGYALGDKIILTGANGTANYEIYKIGTCENGSFKLFVSKCDQNPNDGIFWHSLESALGRR